MPTEEKKKKIKIKTKKRHPLKTVEEVIKFSILIMAILLIVIGLMMLVYKLSKIIKFPH
jgi:cell division septal protein FtsQ